MVDIPEHLLLRSAEAKAKALGVPVEQVLAEMRGEALPPSASTTPSETPEVSTPDDSETSAGEEPAVEADVVAIGDVAEPEVQADAQAVEPDVVEQPLAAVATTGDAGPDVANSQPPASGGDSPLAATVSPRPVAQPEAVPEGVRTQRLLTVVKARAIQQVKSSPADKVNTWPHLMIAEFTALLVMTGFLIILSVILQAPLLELANFNATPNPSKAPWYFLGLQELLSYYDPQIAGVIVPGISGLIGFMAIPYIDRNPSTKPSDRKFAILLFTFFLAGSATLTMLGVLFRGPGFNFTYPWADGIWFDDLKDWVYFE